MSNKRAVRWSLVWLSVAALSFGASVICLAETAGPQPLTLDQAIQIAMENNLQRRMAEQDLRVAQDKVAQANSAYYPKLTLSGGVSRLNDQPSLVKVARNLAALNNGIDKMADLLALSNMSDTYAPYYQAMAAQLNQAELPSDGLTYSSIQLHLEQPLYTGNKLTATNKLAKANELSAKAGLDAADQSLVLDVKRAYFTVLMAQQMERTMAEAVADMEHHLVEANAYFKAGMVPKLDVMRAEVKLADLKQKELLVQNNLDLAKTAFNFILGVDLGMAYTLADTINYHPLAADLPTCQQQAIANRPEVAAVSAKVAMARQGVEVVKSAGKPVVALVADGHRTEPVNDTPTLSVGLVARMTLIDGGMVKNQVAEAEDTLKKAETGLELTQRAVKLEVEQAYRNTQVALATIKVAEQSMAQAQETVRMAEVSYKAGLSTSLERIDAEVGLTQAKTNYTQALSMYNIALAQLERAMGVQ